MVEFYKILDEENRNSIPINSKLLIKTIKSVDGRNKEVYSDWVEIYETLTGKKFNKKEEYKYL